MTVNNSLKDALLNEALRRIENMTDAELLKVLKIMEQESCAVYIEMPITVSG